MNYFGSIFAMVVCIAMSAYFSATETAFSSLNKTRLKVLADNGNKRAALALKLSEDYDKLISTILIGNNIVNIMVASIGTLLFVGLYGDIGATVSTVVVTIVVLIFGEITPKSVAKDTPERFALFSAPFIRLWILVLTPLNFLFSQWKKLVSRFFKTDDNAKMSHEELLLFMEDVEQDGGIDENEGELLRNALEFRDLTAAEILTHRIELEAVDIDESHEEIARVFTQSRFSRLLVYRDTIDQIVGVLHQKDFYINGKMTDQPITAIMTEPLFVYQHTKIRDILKMLQHQKSHVAVVVDDFGGTLGIVTMEDILEELVASSVFPSSRSKCPNSFAPSLANGYMIFTGSPRSPDTFCTISFGEVYPQSARIPFTVFGKSSPAANNTIAAPMEMPPSTIFVSSPNRSVAYFVHSRQSYCSLIPKLKTLPSLFPCPRSSTRITLCPASLASQNPPQKSRSAAP